MAYLVTHSLLSSWLYAIKDNPHEDATTERDPMQDFLKVLRREPTPTTQAMRDGIAFEDLVTAIATDVTVPPVSAWFDAADKIAGIIRGGTFQCGASKRLTVRGVDIVLYGRLDALKAGVIYDIKFSKSYERGKYINSTQHPVYLAIVPGATRFDYLVSNGAEVWTESYSREETPDIIPTISEFLGWLDTTGLMPVYREYWRASER